MLFNRLAFFLWSSLGAVAASKGDEFLGKWEVLGVTGEWSIGSATASAMFSGWKLELSSTEPLSNDYFFYVLTTEFCNMMSMRFECVEESDAEPGERQAERTCIPAVVVKSTENVCGEGLMTKETEAIQFIQSICIMKTEFGSDGIKFLFVGNVDNFLYLTKIEEAKLIPT